VAVRVTPGIVAGGHEKIATAHEGSKFGLAPVDAARACQEAREDPRLDWRGLHVHLGSQVDDPGVLEGVVRWFREFCDAHALEPRLIDVGGGLGIPYGYEPAPDARALAAAVAAAALRHFPAARLIIEPGRSVAGPAGITLYRALTSKTAADGTRWVALDGGMADNPRPALYGARYTVAAAGRLDEPASERVSLAGRHCESGDVLAHDVDLPLLAAGDLVAFAATGAYTQSMASTYNAIPRIAAVLVDGGEARLLTRRETIAELLARDL
jgi:diaminopimelate decarboxylase